MYSLAIGDFDEDGHLALAAAAADAANVSVLLGDGAGAFGTPAPFDTGTGPRAVATADLDEDGHLDLAIANADSGDVSVLRRTACARRRPTRPRRLRVRELPC